MQADRTFTLLISANSVVPHCYVIVLALSILLYLVYFLGKRGTKLCEFFTIFFLFVFYGPS